MLCIGYRISSIWSVENRCCFQQQQQSIIYAIAANVIIVKYEMHGHTEQDAQLSQRDCAAGCISFGKKWKTGTGRQYFTDIIGLSSTTVI